ncbi:MAG: hypothetical protein C5B52_04700 [Bacteroidetes bacterium]|nr:MAG: hypothetical protein C5B52_04700 [Bacteroidota bacterium]
MLKDNKNPIKGSNILMKCGEMETNGSRISILIQLLLYCMNTFHRNHYLPEDPQIEFRNHNFFNNHSNQFICIMKLAISIFTLMILSVACKQVVDTKAEEAKLIQTSLDWSKLASTDSIDRILSYWADDAVVLSPGEAPIKGKKAIREMVEGSKKIPGFKISWETLSASVSKDGDLGYLMEQNEISFKDSTGQTITQKNKGVTIWKKQEDGSWKNIVDTWNALPPAK